MTILSLFDHSLQWSQPYWDAGYNVIEMDILNDPSVDLREINYTWLMENVIEHLGESFDGILAGPPCTDFAVSGAQYWPKKDEDGTTARSLELIDITLQLVEIMEGDEDYQEENPDSTFWVLENPVGRLPKLRPELGKPIYFDPWEYAGYLDLDYDKIDFLRKKDMNDLTAEDIQFIKDSNLYTKKTGLWGNFTMPEKKPVDPIRVCKQGSWLMKLGGKSQKTKSSRSDTPMGFSQAFHQANRL